MTRINAPCPGCDSQIEFAPDGRYGRAVARCEPCGDHYELAPAGISRLDAGLPVAPAPPREPKP